MLVNSKSFLGLCHSVDKACLVHIDPGLMPSKKKKISSLLGSFNMDWGVVSSLKEYSNDGGCGHLEKVGCLDKCLDCIHSRASPAHFLLLP